MGSSILQRLRISEQQLTKNTPAGLESQNAGAVRFPRRRDNPAHRGITQNWVDACLKGTPLLAPGIEGINGVELSNAMYLSTWLNTTVAVQ